jgi:hypothetical protein
VIWRLLKLPLRLVGLLFSLVGLAISLVFVVGMVELFGLFAYFQWRHRAAFEALMADGLTPTRVVDFLLASPDRLAVAGGLAVLGVVLVLTGDSSGRGHSHHVGGGDADFDDGGGFGGVGGFGDAGGADGGGGGGGGDGGGGE